MGRRWSSEETVLLRQLLGIGHSYASAARVLGRTWDQVRGKCRTEGWKSTAKDKPELDPPPDIARYDGYLVLPGDLGGGLMIAADIHAPCTDWLMASRLALVARKYLEKPRRLVLAGDMMNWDVYSKYEGLLPLHTLRQEIDAARFAVSLWLATFDHIYLCLGNHDYRWLRALKGAFEADTFAELIKALIGNDERLTVNVYSYLDITCETTGDWRITHTPEYSKIPLSKARIMSNMCKDKNLALAHQHHAGVILDESGRFILVDIPALVDADKLAYVQLAATSKPAMKRGFVMLKNGYPYLFADGLTDWSFWIDE